MKYILFITALFVSSAFALEIQNLRVVPKDIDAGDITRIMFKLSEPSALSLAVKDLSGNTVTSLVSNALYPAGQFSVEWKTSKKNGAGYYTPVVTAVSQHSGETVTKRIETKTAKMTAVPFETTDLPGSDKRISYSIGEPALVSIRVGINNGPMYKIISNWELNEPGSYSVDWNGWDNDHVLKVDQLANYLIDVRSIPVKMEALHINNSKKSNATVLPAAELLREIHAFVPEFSVASAPKKTNSGKTDNVELSLIVDEKTLDELGDIPYEYVLYIDGKRYGEIENSTSPYTWEISTDNLSKGTHIFTLMICTSIEQINSKSFKVTL